MACNKLFGMESAYLLLLVFIVAALCLPAAVSAYTGEPVLSCTCTSTPVMAGNSGTVTVTISETRGSDYAANLIVSLSTDTPGVSFGNQQTISKIGEGGTRTLTFPIYVDSSVSAGKYDGKVKISYKEYGAMDIGTYSHTITNSFQYTVLGKPSINYQIEDVSLVSGKSGTASVKLLEVGGKSPAQNVQITLSTDTPGVTFGYVRPISQLDAGGQYTFSVPIRTTSSVKPGTYFGKLKISYDGSSSSDNTFTYTIIGEPVVKYQVSVPDVTISKSGTATVTVSETGGQGPAQNVKVTLSTDTQGVSFGSPQTIYQLSAGGKQILSFPIKVASSAKAGTYTGKITIDCNGQISTDSFKYTLIGNPVIKYEVYIPEVVSGESGTATVTVSETSLECSVENVKVTLSTDTQGVSFGSSQTIPQLSAGGKQKLSFPVYTTSSVKSGTYLGKIKFDYNDGQSSSGNFQYTIAGEPAIKFQVSASDVLAGDKGTATVTVSETGGDADAQNIKVTLSADTPGVSFGISQTISQLNAGGIQTLSFPIYTDSSVNPGTYTGKIKIDYDGQSSTDSFKYTIIGKPGIKSQASVPDVVLGKSNTATVTVSETGGQSSVENIAVSLSTDTQGVSFGGSQTISQLNAGESKILKFPISTTSSVRPGKYSGKINIAYNGQTSTDTFTYTVHGESVIKYEIYIPDVVSGDSGTATVTVSETSYENSVENIVVSLSTDTQGVSFGGSQTISKLSVGGSQTLKFPVYTTSSVKPGSYIGKIIIDSDGPSISSTFPYTIVAPGVGESVSRIASGKSPLSPITIIIACIVTAFVAVYTGSRRERK